MEPTQIRQLPQAMVLPAETEETVQPEARVARGEPVDWRWEPEPTVHSATVGMAGTVEQQGCPEMVAGVVMGVQLLWMVAMAGQVGTREPADQGAWAARQRAQEQWLGITEPLVR